MKIQFTRKAEKELRQLDAATRKRLQKKLAWYLTHEDPLVFTDTLTDFELGEYRFRIGEYRVVFEVNEDLMSVTAIGHRRDIYR
ncbi:type II toxin-antitoxin system RelE/ParE family toxin [Patescibacteria group bacterium]|nr:type II toxin-antitoxin system RelE/ParE family toxin [Patescibacteria group bacterium]MBU1016170.1 type II toxin-antitoxin system RelE/ParE family toxin [Patescibacteria group bacterium]MBU1684718.1 type II toxin-antitoxin system RelE/ParE family toxin [Patescibacteria group bacterium]MBU1938903.1 type II toxin-antitoxin system RelE/ParE family toxin [Patescibacteria group bacterium]